MSLDWSLQKKMEQMEKVEAWYELSKEKKNTLPSENYFFCHKS